jgi:hypothetical protein
MLLVIELWPDSTILGRADSTELLLVLCYRQKRAFLTVWGKVWYFAMGKKSLFGPIGKSLVLCLVQKVILSLPYPIL